MDHQTPETRWLSEVDEILRSSRSAAGTVNALSEWLWKNVAATDVLPQSLPDGVATLLSALRQELDAISQSASEARERYRDRVLSRLLGGWMLSREEYYLLAAMGHVIFSAESLGLSSFDDYDVYRMFCYEDPERRTHINPEEEPRQRGRIGIRFGKPPEELQLNALRPEQLAFFRDHLPTVLARFKSPKEA